VIGFGLVASDEEFDLLEQNDPFDYELKVGLGKWDWMVSVMMSFDDEPKGWRGEVDGFFDDEPRVE